MKFNKMPVAVALAVLGWATSAAATTITFNTSNGTTVNGNRPVNAQALFTTSANLVTITLTNLQVGIKDISQTLTGVSFALDNLLTSTTISSSAGLERTVNANRTFSDGAVVPTGWINLLDGQSMQIMLPDNYGSHAIIGPASGSTYAGANSSIAGSNDNPFLTGPITFSIPVPGVTAANTVDWAVFHFGPNCAEYSLACKTSQVPEPGTLSLVAIAVGCGLFFGRRGAAKRSV